MKQKKIAIIGAGTMGGGITICCIAAGLKTIVIDLDDSSLSTLNTRAKNYFNRLVEKDVISEIQKEEALSNLTLSSNLGSIQTADLVIEAVFEDLEVKKDLFAKISQYLTPDTIVATNTSALRVADLATALPYPEQFLGLHYFSPAEINPLVELVSGPSTKEKLIPQATEFLKKTGKTVLSCKDSNGFAVNRFFCPYTNEAARIVDEGLATTAQVDALACELFDLAIGPFAVMNIIKPRINLNAVGNLSKLGAFYEPAAGLIEIGAADGAWQIDETSDELATEFKVNISDRLQAALFFPVLEALSEEVAAPDDFDLGARLALRFGRPPVSAMRELGQNQVETLVSSLAQKYNSVTPTKGISAVFT